MAAEGEQGSGGGGSSLEGKSKAEIRREVQAQISQANYQVSSKFISFQDITMDAIKSQQKRSGGRRTRSAPVAAPARPASKPAPLEAIRAREAARYARTKYRLVGDNAFAVALGGCAVWAFVGLKAAVSYGLGGALGTAYLLLLGRFVETLGSGEGGGGGGPARLALVILLVMLCSKNRETLDLIPAVAGFLTYQASTLLQALYDDEADEAAAEAASGGAQQ